MPKVKICGLKTLEDVEIVNKYLPEYVGFVFAPTKRFVTDEQALMMKQALAPQIQAVGVFVRYVKTRCMWQENRHVKNAGNRLWMRERNFAPTVEKSIMYTHRERQCLFMRVV